MFSRPEPDRAINFNSFASLRRVSSTRNLERITTPKALRSNSMHFFLSKFVASIHLSQTLSIDPKEQDEQYPKKRRFSLFTSYKLYIIMPMVK